MLADANVCVFPFEDEENGHIVFKSQFIKDSEKGEEILWWVPCSIQAQVPSSIQAQGRVVCMPMTDMAGAVEKRKQFRLETKFRQQHGERIQNIHQEALKKMGQSGYLEKRFDEGLHHHLGKMYTTMQLFQEELSATTIRMKRLRFFPPIPDEHVAQEDLVPEKEVKNKNLLIISSSFIIIIII